LVSLIAERTTDLVAARTQNLALQTKTGELEQREVETAKNLCDEKEQGLKLKEEFGAQVNELRGNIDLKAEMISKLKSSENAKNQQLTRLEGEKKALTAQVGYCSDLLAKSHEDMDLKQGRIIQLQDENKNLAHQISALTEEKRKSAADAEEQLEDLGVENDNLKAEMVTITNDKAVLENREP